jgi:glycosyl transferase family 25
MPEPVTEINSLLQQHFDKVVVLTVPRFTERHEKVKQSLNGISFDFFYGTDKNELTEEFIKANYHYCKKNSLTITQTFKPLNTGEIACSLSHRKIYQAMVDNNWSHVLIFEDDVMPDYNTLPQLQNCLNELPADWELFYLGYLKRDKINFSGRLKILWYKVLSAFGLAKMSVQMVKNILPKNYSSHLYKAGFHDCTHAYAVSLSGAKKLLAAQTPVTYRADNLLSALTLKNELKAFAVKHFLFNQEVFTDLSKKSYIRENWSKV